MRLVLGIIPMLIVAGTVEGFVSPSEIAVKWKYTLAAGLFGLLLLYLMRKSPKVSPTDLPALSEIAPSENALREIANDAAASV